MYDLLLKQARTATTDEPVDIAIAQGRIVAIQANLPAEGTSILDLGGRVVMPGLVESHTHLDKALTRDRFPNRSGTFQEAAERNSQLSSQATQEDTYERAYRTALWASRCGTTTLRTHINVDEATGLKGIHAALELREKMRHLLDIQIVTLAHPQAGEEGRRVRELVVAALEEGADAVGGATNIAHERRKELVDEVFRIALRTGKPIDLHVDESDNPQDFALGYLAERTLQEGYIGRVVAGHCCSLAAVDDRTAAQTIELVARAGITVVTLPAANLYLQGRHDAQPVRRGITRVKELIAGGVNVVCGSDNIKDMFNPFGKPDLVLMAHLLGYAAQMGGWDEQDYLLESITQRPARALGITSELAVGAPADLLVLETDHPQNILSDLPARSFVIKRGRIVHGAEADNTP